MPYQLNALYVLVSASVQLEVGLEVGVIRAQMTVVHSVL